MPIRNLQFSQGSSRLISEKTLSLPQERDMFCQWAMDVDGAFPSWSQGSFNSGPEWQNVYNMDNLRHQVINSVPSHLALLCVLLLCRVALSPTIACFPKLKSPGRKSLKNRVVDMGRAGSTVCLRVVEREAWPAWYTWWPPGLAFSSLGQW